jgi:hypothetical protein
VLEKIEENEEADLEYLPLGILAHQAGWLTLSQANIEILVLLLA